MKPRIIKYSSITYWLTVNQQHASIQQYLLPTLLFTWELHWRDRPQTVLGARADPWTHPSQSIAPSAQTNQMLGCTSRPKDNKNFVNLLQSEESWKQISVYLIISLDVALV